MALEVGRLLGPYEILAPIGAGGMGEVYKARDTRLLRTVAIKVLAARGLSDPESHQRFQNEARVISSLNHPHICTLYDIGRQDDIDYLVMEFLEGETLDHRLERGQLPLSEALQHARALAQAIDVAHSRGIIHRDLKPGNVMLTASGLKLLDFGVAKLRERADSAAETDFPTTTQELSGASHRLGTLRYMAPEQLEGREADARTDIFALGVVIYEMITGRRPFAGDTDTDVITAILSAEPPLMRVHQPMTPPALEHVIETCLAKDPNHRWQHARDLTNELQWLADSGLGRHARARSVIGHLARQPAVFWVGVSAAAIVIGSIGLIVALRWEPLVATPSLVVLPCRAIGGDAPDQAYCDGLTDTLSAKLMSLTASHPLQLTSPSEVRRSGVADALAARRFFGATFVLEGSVLRAGSSLRINYVLVDPVTLRQLDAYSVTASAADPFTLQDRVVEWATGRLAVKLNDAERQSLRAHSTQVPGAEELYLQGRGYLLDPQTTSNVDNAIQLFTQALERDPRYALAVAGLGRAEWQKYDTTHAPQWADRARATCDRAVQMDAQLPPAYLCQGTVNDGTGAYEDARAAFEKALKLDPTSDEAYLGLARSHEHLRNFAAAEETYRRAVALRPQYWAGHVWLGTFLRDQGRYSEAAEQYERAVALTPDNPSAYSQLGSQYALTGRYEAAIHAFNRSIELVPSFSAYSNLGMTFFRLRRFDKAIAAFEQARQLQPGDYRGFGSLARAYYWKGDRARARELYMRAVVLGEEVLRVNPRDVDAHILLADYEAKLGHRTKAIELLSSAGGITQDPHRLFFGAIVYNQLGDRDLAIAWLQDAVAKGLPQSELPAWIELDSLRNDARFKALERRH